MIEKRRELRAQRIVEKIRDKHELIIGHPHIDLCEQSLNHTGRCPLTETPQPITVFRAAHHRTQ